MCILSRISCPLLAGAGLVALGAVALYGSLPGLCGLPRERQRTLDGITTTDDVVRRLQGSGMTGWELVAVHRPSPNHAGIH